MILFPAMLSGDQPAAEVTYNQSHAIVLFDGVSGGNGESFRIC